MFRGIFFLIFPVFFLNTALFSQNNLTNEKAQVFHAVKTFDKNIGKENFRYKMAHLSVKESCLSPVVFLTAGSGYCGSGGCTILMFDCAKNGYRLIGATSVALPPVYITKSITRGYHDIKVHVRNKDLGLLKFNGKRYTSSASMAPAAKHNASDTLLMDEGFVFP